MNIHKPPGWLRKLYHSFHWSMKSEAKNIYLTFDDGPTPEITNWVLEQLAVYNAKATFFCIGRNVERHPEIYKSILDERHAVGNHTYSHLKGWKTKNTEYQNDIDLCSQFVKSKLFRPPYGKIKPRQIKYLKKQGYKLFMWDVLSEDYNVDKTPINCLNTVKKYTANGSIIVFHDSLKGSKNLYGILPDVLKHFSELGYNFCILK